MERVLGLDVGRVRVGVAVSCPMAILAQPLEVIDRRRTCAMTRIGEIVRHYDAATIVVGRPLTLRGAEGPAVEATEAFVRVLCERLERDITWWDERLTTAAAQRAMIAGGVRRDDRRQRIDKVAAALILQAFLDARSTRAARGAGEAF